MDKPLTHFVSSDRVQIKTKAGKEYTARIIKYLPKIDRFLVRKEDDTLKEFGVIDPYFGTRMVSLNSITKFF